MTKNKLINFRIDKDTYDKLKELDKNISAMLRNYLKKQIDSETTDADNEITNALMTMKKEIQFMSNRLKSVEELIKQASGY